MTLRDEPPKVIEQLLEKVFPRLPQFGALYVGLWLLAGPVSAALNWPILPEIYGGHPIGEFLTPLATVVIVGIVWKKRDLPFRAVDALLDEGEQASDIWERHPAVTWTTLVSVTVLLTLVLLLQVARFFPDTPLGLLSSEPYTGSLLAFGASGRLIAFLVSVTITLSSLAVFAALGLWSSASVNQVANLVGAGDTTRVSRALRPLHPDRYGGLRPVGSYITMASGYLYVFLAGTALGLQGDLIVGLTATALVGIIMSFFLLAPLWGFYRAVEREREELLDQNWREIRQLEERHGKHSIEYNRQIGGLLGEQHSLKSLRAFPISKEHLVGFAGVILAPFISVVLERFVLGV